MSELTSNLATLFPEGDHRFHLTLRRAAPQDFFARRDATGDVLAERRRWLESDPARYVLLQPEGEALLAEFAQMAAPWVEAGRSSEASRAQVSPLEKLGALGAQLEPDIVLLSPDSAGQFRLRGGALCFPTGWALEAKVGQTLNFIHDGVPGLNAALGSPIHQFLSRLKPGGAFLRDNWGIAATAELNLHPARAIEPPRSPISLNRLWLRVEHQALVSLPVTGGIVFGIRIVLHRLDTLAGSAVGERLKHALLTMPPELVFYKRLADILPQIVGQL